MLAGADSLARAAAAVAAGGVIAYPTEAVYGIGCDPARLDAVERVIRLKGRDAGKGLILVAAGWNQLDPYLAPLAPSLRRTVEATWPGPNTWILPARAGVSRLLTGGSGRIAVRISAFSTVRDLCNACACALVSTSANPAGRPPARTAAEVRDRFADGIDYLVEGDTGGETRPSRIYDGASGQRLR